MVVVAVDKVEIVSGSPVNGINYAEGRSSDSTRYDKYKRCPISF